AAGLAHRRLRAGPLSGADGAAGGRPVRGCPGWGDRRHGRRGRPGRRGQGAGMTVLATLGLTPVGAVSAMPSAVLADVDPAKVQTGAIGMVVFLLLCAATFLLLRSFRHQMRKVEQADLPHEKPRPHGPRPGAPLPVDPPGPGDEHPNGQTPEA